jgi:hypothetical protein
VLAPPQPAKKKAASASKAAATSAADEGDLEIKEGDEDLASILSELEK